METIHQIKTTSTANTPIEGLFSSEELHFLHRELKPKADLRLIPAAIELNKNDEPIIRLQLPDPGYEAKVDGEKLELDKSKPETERSFPLISGKPTVIEWVDPGDGTKNKIVIELQKQIQVGETEFQKLATAGTSLREKISTEQTVLVDRKGVGYDLFSKEEEEKLRNILKGTFGDVRLTKEDTPGLSIYVEEVNLIPNVLCIYYGTAKILIETYEKGYVGAVQFGLNHEKAHELKPTAEILAQKQERREELLKQGVPEDEILRREHVAEELHNKFQKSRGIPVVQEVFPDLAGEVNAQLYAFGKSNDPENDYVHYLAMMFKNYQNLPKATKDLKTYIEQNAIGHHGIDLYLNGPFIDSLEKKVEKAIEEMKL